MTLPIALIGAKALYLLYAWLLGCIIASWLSDRKGYGERPGLATAESLSAYILYRPRLSSAEPDRTVISNIHPKGLKIAAAGREIAGVIDDALTHRASGAKLAQILSDQPEDARR